MEALFSIDSHCASGVRTFNQQNNKTFCCLHSSSKGPGELHPFRISSVSGRGGRPSKRVSEIVQFIWLNAKREYQIGKVHMYAYLYMSALPFWFKRFGSCALVSFVCTWVIAFERATNVIPVRRVVDVIPVRRVVRGCA